MKIKQNKTSTEVVYLLVNNDYINRLTLFLEKENFGRKSVTTPENHKQVILNDGLIKIPTKFTRPYVCFNYSPSATFLKCFPLGTFKKHDRRNDNRFYYIDGENGRTFGKIIVVKPIYIPKKYLNVINFKSEQKLAKKNTKLINWLTSLEKEFKICKQEKLLVFRHYDNIKFNRKVGEIDFSIINKKYFIDEKLVYKFCQSELEKLNSKKIRVDCHLD